MAGSLKYFLYTDDANAPYSVNVDESNGEATVGGIRLCLVRTAAHPNLPTKLKKRYVNAFVTATPNIKRRFWVGNPLAIPQILAGGAFLASAYPTAADATPVTVPWTVSSYRGEKNSPPPALNATSGDTGLTDGDVGRD
jgi:hypothetical protein